MSALEALCGAAGAAGDAALAGLAAALQASPGAIVVGLDLEACAGPGGGDARDADRARIVQIALVEISALPLPGQVDALVAEQGEAAGEEVPEDLERVLPLTCGAYVREDATLVDPACPIDAASTAVHGIDDAAVDGAPRIVDLIDVLALRLLGSEDRPVTLVGYNGRAYDAPLLAAELRRAAAWLRRTDLDRAALAEQVAEHVLAAVWADPLAVRKRAEPMDLSGSVRRYLGVTLQDAHNASSDIAGTILALGAQLALGHAASLQDALEASAPPSNAYDRAGKLVCDPGVDPAHATAAQVRYAFGKSKGQTVADEPGFARWMLTKDFPEETKARVRALLATLPAESGTKGAYARRR